MEKEKRKLFAQEVFLVLQKPKIATIRSIPLLLQHAPAKAGLVLVQMAWESTCPSHMKPCTHPQQIQLPEQEQLPKVLSYADNTAKVEQGLLHQISLLLLLFFLYHLLLQSGCFSFSLCLRKKGPRDFFALGLIRVNTPLLLLAPFFKPGKLLKIFLHATLVSTKTVMKHIRRNIRVS